MAEQKTCFVIMPFGEKPDGEATLDFDQIYHRMIKPAVEDAEVACIRSDEIGEPGSIHREMIRRIFESDVVVVDITTWNANVFYELGVRHALKSSVTVLIRKRGTEAPFNIQGLRIIEYETTADGIARARAEIASFVDRGLKSERGDSLVHDILDLEVGTAPTLAASEEIAYVVNRAPEKQVCVIGGDIRHVKGIDVWVNSENTNMQMARFFDRSVSGTIRFLGAEKNEAGRVTKDSIAEQLAVKMDTDTSVHPATVIVTGSGQLAATHGVKRIFHAAAVMGAIGRGYTPVPNVSECVANALEKADSPHCSDDPPKSILFPLMGTGTAEGNPRQIVGPLLETAVDYLVRNPASSIDRVCFIARREREFDACTKFLDASPAVTRSH